MRNKVSKNNGKKWKHKGGKKEQSAQHNARRSTIDTRHLGHGLIYFCFLRKNVRLMLIIYSRKYLFIKCWMKCSIPFPFGSRTANSRPSSTRRSRNLAPNSRIAELSTRPTFCRNVNFLVFDAAAVYWTKCVSNCGFNLR